MNVEGEVTVTIVIMELSKHVRSTLLDYPGRLKETENQRLNLRLSIQMVLSDMIARSRIHSLIHISIQFSFRHCCSIIYSLDRRGYCPSSDAKCKQIITLEQHQNINNSVYIKIKSEKRHFILGRT